MITAYTPEEIRAMEKRIKSLEEVLSDYVRLHQKLINIKMINPALGSPIKAQAKKLLNQKP